MKKKDTGVIIVVAVFAGIVSLIFSNLVISTKDNKVEEVEKVEQLVSTFEAPDKTYFNSEAVNPTKNIQLGQEPNTNPFGNQ